jgi:hypothetical protein
MKIQMALLQGAVGDRTQAIDPELDVAVASISHKPLTLNHTFLAALALQQGEKLGESAMDLLVGRIDGTVTGPPKALVLPMDVVQVG